MVKGIIGRDVIVVIVASLEQRAMDERDDLLVFNMSSLCQVDLAYIGDYFLL